MALIYFPILFLIGACLQGLNNSHCKCKCSVLALMKNDYGTVWMIIRGVYYLSLESFLRLTELDFLVTDANVFCYTICKK